MPKCQTDSVSMPMTRIIRQIPAKFQAMEVLDCRETMNPPSFLVLKNSTLLNRYTYNFLLCCFKSYFHLIKIKLDLQVTTTTKTIREIQYIGPDGQPLDYVPSGAGQARLSSSSAAGVQPFPQLSYGGQDQQQQNQQPQHGYANYAEYPHRPPTPPSPSDRSNSPPPQHREPGKTYSFSVLIRGRISSLAQTDFGLGCGRCGKTLLLFQLCYHCKTPETRDIPD